MSYLFSSESVSQGHPDKVCDQISDALLDEFLAYDSSSHCAIETFCTTGQVVIMGEVTSEAYVDLQTVARRTIRQIGYTKSEYNFDGSSCGVLCAIHEQSADIHRGVVRDSEDQQGAGDQGMMFGYACSETSHYMPVGIELAHILMQELARIREEGKEMTYLRPDGKGQVTVQYSDAGLPERIHTIVVSAQHDEFISAEGLTVGEADERMRQQIEHDVRTILLPRVRSRCDEKVLSLFDDDLVLLVNPTGKFVIGGPDGDTGLTGRKIIVDTYGGRGAHGGGAFSGKDPSKVDRSAAYMARYIAKNCVAAGVAKEILVQLAYAIGVAEPVSVYVNTYGSAQVAKTDGEIATVLSQLFDLRPKAIERELKLRQPMYRETAAYGHMGRESTTVVKTFNSMYYSPRTVTVELFTWEKLDKVDTIRQAFHIE